MTTKPVEMRRQLEDSTSNTRFAETLKELRAPLNDLIKQRVGWTDRRGNEHHVEYVEWHTVADVLDRVAPTWSYTIRDIRVIGDLIAVTAAITIDGVTREGVGTGPALSETGIKKAESDALKRAARMFGVARDLYKDTDDEPTAPQGGNHKPQVVSMKPQTPQQLPANPKANNSEDLVTPRQLVAIRAIANSQGLEAEAECQKLLRCDLKEISRRAASALIENLKGRNNGPQS